MSGLNQVSRRCDYYDEQFKGFLVLNGLEELYATKELTDCEFLVGINKISFKAHKLVLAMASKVFRKELYEKSSVMPILVPDVDSHIFRALLCYIYLNELPSVDDVDEYGLNRDIVIVKLWSATNKYNLHDLNRKYYDMIKINLRTWSYVYVSACKFVPQDNSSNVLLSRCFKMLAVKTPEILSENDSECSYFEIPESLLKELFAYKYMNIESELDLFYALVKYANQTGWNPHDQYLLDKDQDGNELLSLSQKNIREAMKQIRFLTMTLKEFDTVPAKSGFFTEVEVKTIRDRIAENKPIIAFSKTGFSKDMSKRYEHLEMKIIAPPCHDKDTEKHSFRIPLPSTTLGKTMKFASQDFVWQIIIYMRTSSLFKKEYTVYLKCDSPELETWKCYAQLDMNIVITYSNLVDDGKPLEKTMFENIPWYCFKCDAKYCQTKPMLFQDMKIRYVNMELVISRTRVSNKSKQSNVSPTYGQNMPTLSSLPQNAYSIE